MTRRKTTKTKSEEVAKDDNGVETYNDIDDIKTVPKTVVKPAEVNSNDVMLPRSSSRYTKSLR